MLLNDSQFEMLKELALLQFHPYEIAIMMDIPIELRDEFIASCIDEAYANTTIYNTYMSGLLEQEAIIRKSIFTAAKQGSPPAQNTAAKLIMNNRFKINDQ